MSPGLKLFLVVFLAIAGCTVAGAAISSRGDSGGGTRPPDATGQALDVIWDAMDGAERSALCDSVALMGPTAAADRLLRGDRLAVRPVGYDRVQVVEWMSRMGERGC